MNRGIWTRLRLALLIILLAASVWLGLKEGLDGYRDAATGGQRIAAASQLLYGAAAIPCLMALVIRPRWARPVLILWVLALTLTGALAPVVWGGAGWIAGLEGGMLALVVGGLVVWGSLVHIRGWTGSGSTPD